MPNGDAPEDPPKALFAKEGVAPVGLLNKLPCGNAGPVVEDGWKGALDPKDGVDAADAIIDIRNGFGPPVIWGRSPPPSPGLVPFVPLEKDGSPVAWAFSAPRPVG